MSPTPDPQLFVQSLREAGLVVPVGASIRFTEALGILLAPVGPALYWAARSTLVVRHDDIGTFDDVFERFFGGAPEDASSIGADAADEMADDGPAPEGGPGSEESEPDPFAAERPEALGVVWSRHERLMHKDLAACTPEELAELHRAVSRMRLDAPLARSRRHGPARRGAIDLRRSVRSSMRAGTELVAPVRRAQRDTRRRVVLLVDVSGSMEPYARTLLRFAHAAVQSSRRIEVFCFATRLTRLTHELRCSEPDVALERAGVAATDMSGGTRLGEVLGEFNRRWGLPGVARGAVVVILSDGWDRGSRGLVDAEMSRLALVAARIVWVNPLKASAGYEPLAAGMAEALGHVDDFVEGHSTASLSELADLLAGAVAHPRGSTLAIR